MTPPPPLGCTGMGLQQNMGENDYILFHARLKHVLTLNTIEENVFVHVYGDDELVVF